MTTTTQSYKLSDIANMTDSQQEQCFSDMYYEAMNPTIDQLYAQRDELDRELAQLEERYNISSQQIKEILAYGYFEAKRVAGSADLCSWKMLLDSRDSLTQKIEARSKSVK